MTKTDHAEEVRRYRRLAREARNQTTSAQPAEYYEKMAAAHYRLAAEGE
jgi:hypothetical protein